MTKYNSWRNIKRIATENLEWRRLFTQKYSSSIFYFHYKHYIEQIYRNIIGDSA